MNTNIHCSLYKRCILPHSGGLLWNTVLCFMSVCCWCAMLFSMSESTFHCMRSVSVECRSVLAGCESRLCNTLNHQNKGNAGSLEVHHTMCVCMCACVWICMSRICQFTHTHVIHRWSTWLYSKMPFLCFVFWLYNELVLLQKSATFMFYEFIFFISYPFFTLLCMREFQFVCTIISCVWLTVFAVYLGFVWRSLLATVSRGTCNNVRFIVL